jgi:hypothetical protein
MSTPGLFVSAIGIIYLIYSILFRRTITIYNKNNKLVMHDMNNYLRLQLYFSIIGALFLIITGLILTITNTNFTYVVLAPIPFHAINSFFRFISKKRGYISYN